MDLISVIITTFNSEKTIERLLNSVFAQEGTGEKFVLEVLVADDGSTDKTLDCLRRYPVIILPSERNSGGPNAGRNRALAICKGKFICIADHDDEWMPFRIRKLLPLMEKVPIVTSGFTLLDESSGRTEIIRNKAAESELFYPVNETFRNRLIRSKKGQLCYLGSILFRAELREIRFEEVFGVCDYDWLVRLFQDRSSAEVNESLYIRRVDGSNLSLNDNYRKKDYYFSLYFLESLEIDYPVECRLAVKRINGSRARFYYLTGDMKMARRFFLKSGLSFVNLAYLVTSIAGHQWVKKHFKIFG